METEIIDYTIDKLGDIITPIGTLVWEAYMKQMVIEGCSSLILGLVFFIFFAYSSIKLYHSAIDFPTGGYDFPSKWVGFIVCIVLMLFSLLMIEDGILHIYNPEYYVIQKILSAISGV